MGNRGCAAVDWLWPAWNALLPQAGEQWIYSWDSNCPVAQWKTFGYQQKYGTQWNITWNADIQIYHLYVGYEVSNNLRPSWNILCLKYGSARSANCFNNFLLQHVAQYDAICINMLQTIANQSLLMSNWDHAGGKKYRAIGGPWHGAWPGFAGQGYVQGPSQGFQGGQVCVIQKLHMTSGCFYEQNRHFYFDCTSKNSADVLNCFHTL